MTTFSVNLPNRTDTLPQSRDQSKSIAPTAQTQRSTRTRLRALTPLVTSAFRFANVTRASSWRLCGITPAIKETLRSTPTHCVYVLRTILATKTISPL